MVLFFGHVFSVDPLTLKILLSTPVTITQLNLIKQHQTYTTVGDSIANFILNAIFFAYYTFYFFF